MEGVEGEVWTALALAYAIEETVRGIVLYVRSIFQLGGVEARFEVLCSITLLSGGSCGF